MKTAAVALALLTTALTGARPVVAHADASDGWFEPIPSSVQQGVCAQYLYVGLRGSGEPKGLGPTLSNMEANLRARTNSRGGLGSVRVVWLDYPASAGWTAALGFPKAANLPSWFTHSVNVGARKLKALLKDSADRCGSTTDEQWILAGYSQGAIAIDTVVADMKPAERARIAGIQLVGDPGNYPAKRRVLVGRDTHVDATGYWYGSVHAIAFPPGLGDRTYSLCSGGDVFCETSRTKGHLKRGLEVHGGYADDPALAAYFRPFADLLVESRRARIARRPIRNSDLAECVRHQQKIDGTAVSARPILGELMKLTRLDCPQPAHIHGHGIDFTEAAYGTKLTFLRYWTDAPGGYENLSPLSKLKQLKTLYKNLSQCRLPIATVGGRCVPL